MNQSSSQGNRGGFATNRGNYQAGSGFNRRGGSSRNNSNRKNKFCYFCKLQGHRQEECWKQIKENKPCPDTQGRTYWPKIYFMEENPETKSINVIGRSENRMVDNDEEHRFEAAGVNVDREYKPRTAALPQQNLGF